MDYGTRSDRAALEAEFDELPAAGSIATDVSTVVSVRLRGDELATVEQAARTAAVPLSTFIRRAALDVARPLDVRAASASVEAIQQQARGPAGVPVRDQPAPSM